VKGSPALELPVMSRAGSDRDIDELRPSDWDGEGKMVPRESLVLAKRFCVWPGTSFL